MDDNVILLTKSAVLQQLVQTIWYEVYVATLSTTYIVA